MWTGIKAIDALITIARGSRVGIFGAAGAGKSTLLTMLSQASAADAIVVGLVGERGREASDWCAHRNPRMTVVCAASDRSAAERIAAAQTAMAQAACLRTLGLHVLVIIDSLARLGAALREVAVGCGEPLGRGGLPASVFADLAGFVEVAGVTDTGSITLAATVLSEGPQERDPLSEAARSLLDGHIVLSRDMAQEGRYPAVDVPSSASRLMNGVVTAEHARAALVVRRAICALNESRDARSLGLPQVDPWVMAAQQYEGAIDFLLRQGAQSVGSPETVGILCEVAHQIQSAAG